MFRRVLERSQRNYSRLEMIAVMTIVGIGFGLAEDIPYAIGTNAGQMLVRGVTMGHASYGFLMGLLMSKGEATQSKPWTALGFLVPWLMHGLYDFSLSDSMGAYDGSALIALALAAADLVIVIAMVFFMRKRRKDAAYTRPLR